MKPNKPGRGGKRKGAGRPSSYGEKTVTVRVPKSLAPFIKDNLDAIAKLRDDLQS